MKNTDLLKFNAELRGEIQKKRPPLIASLEAFYRYLYDILSISDLKNLDEDLMKQIIDAVRLFSELTNFFCKGHSKDQEACEKGRSFLFALELGGKIPSEFLRGASKEVVSFLKINDFNDLVLPLRLQLRFDVIKGIAIPVETGAHTIEEAFFEALEKEVLVNGKGKPYGYRFCKEGRVFFKTDLSLKLSGHYSLVLGGVHHYNPNRSALMKLALELDSSKWGCTHLVEFWTKKEENGPLFMLLKRSDGAVYSFGVEGREIVSPYQFPIRLKDTASYVKLKIEVSPMEWKTLFNAIEKERWNPKVKEDYFIRLVGKQLKLEFPKNRETFSKKLQKLSLFISQKEPLKRICILEEVV